MSKITAMILCCMVPLLGYAQTNISGTWEGVLNQGYGEFFDKYKIVLHINQEGDQIDGVSYIETANIYAEMKFQGTYKNDWLVFQESHIIRESIPDELSWCIKQGSLQMEIDDGVFQMVGPWQGKAGYFPCNSGLISLKKSIPRA